MAFERRVEHIIRTARSRTGNTTFGVSQGIPQREFVGFVNEAQQRILNLLMQTRSSLFQKQVTLTTTQGQSHVTLPADDIYLGHNVISVHYSHNGNAMNYEPLELRTVRQEVSVQGYPSSYFLLGDDIVLSPIPMNSTATLRVTYQKVIPTLDIRRGLVTDGAATTTTLTLTENSTLLPETEEDLAGGFVDYITIVDKDGVQIVSDLDVNTYNSTTNVLTYLTPITTAQRDLINANDPYYMLFGKSATTNCGLPEVCERYLTEYTVLRAQMRDSNKEFSNTNPLLVAIEQEIVNAVEELEEDIYAIPILDNSMMNYADDM